MKLEVKLNMPRKRVVSRTLRITVVECLFIDTEQESVYTAKVELTGDYKSKGAIIKAVQKQMPPNIQCSKIKNIDTVTAKYAMPEEEFLKHATLQENPKYED